MESKQGLIRTLSATLGGVMIGLAIGYSIGSIENGKVGAFILLITVVPIMILEYKLMVKEHKIMKEVLENMCRYYSVDEE